MSNIYVIFAYDKKPEDPPKPHQPAPPKPKSYATKRLCKCVPFCQL